MNHPIQAASEAKPAISILLADTDRRGYAARLAIAFASLGCRMSVVCTGHHPIETVKVPHRRFAYSPVHPAASLQKAIESSKPDLIVACDDRAVAHLHSLCERDRTSEGEISTLIERSLGPLGSYPVVSSRYALLELAKKLEIRVPVTRCLQAPADLEPWSFQQRPPWVLKADGTWGGSGVRIANTLQEAEQFFHLLKGPCGLKRAVKRLLVNRDQFYLRDWWQKSTRPVIAQAFIPGRPANSAVACWNGKVLSQISVEVLASSHPTGPASVVRRIDNPEMTVAAERIAEKLHLSGFFGLDFVIEHETSAAYLIEMNPRCTPLSQVQVGSESDLVRALHTVLGGQPLPSARPSFDASEVIAFFPQPSDSNSEHQKLSLQNFPHGEPDLAKALQQPFPQQTLLYRIVDYFSSTQTAA